MSHKATQIKSPNMGQNLRGLDPVDYLVLTIKNAAGALKKYGAHQLAFETLTGELDDLRLEARHMEEDCLILPFNPGAERKTRKETRHV
ncbi:MAG: hypothetical protein L3J67_12535 [Hyphomicrobiaceae bacterium]|nr:hypothetical protein [Hyphomicrobiaceae bacterium]